MKRPNILFFFSDQQRADTLGCYGQKLNVTPVLDSLAKEGAKFEYAFTPQPVCGPARACLQTGKYATELGCYINGRPLPKDEGTMAKWLGASGYETAYVGKWHLAAHHHNNELYQDRAIPEELRGGYKDYVAMADVLEFTSHGYGGYVFDKDGKRLDFIGYRADCLTDYAIDYLHHRDREKPFFMFLSYLEPHHQNDTDEYECPDGYGEMFRDFEPPVDLVHGKYEGKWKKDYPNYLGCCRSLDYNMGRLINTLKMQGLYEDTIIIYTSDHGDHFYTQEGEHKRQCFDSCLRVPLIIKGAGGGQFTGGRVYAEPVNTISLPPTIMAMAGLDVPPSMQEPPLQNLIEGKEWPEAVFYQISEAELARGIRTKRWKYCVHAPHVQPLLDMGPRFDTKFYRETLRKAVPASDSYYEQYLFDLANDPYELHNLVNDDSYKEQRKQLSALLVQAINRVEKTKAEILPAM